VNTPQASQAEQVALIFCVIVIYTVAEQAEGETARVDNVCKLVLGAELTFDTAFVFEALVTAELDLDL